MSNRDLLLNAIYRTAAAPPAEPIDVDELAIRLSSLYPQSGLLIDEICTLIREQLANVPNHRQAS